MLAADDQLSANKMLFSYLRKGDFELTVVPNASEVLKTFAQTHPDLLILDLDLIGGENIEFFLSIGR